MITDENQIFATCGGTALFIPNLAQILVVPSKDDPGELNIARFTEEGSKTTIKKWFEASPYPYEISPKYGAIYEKYKNNSEQLYFYLVKEYITKYEFPKPNYDKFLQSLTKQEKKVLEHLIENEIATYSISILVEEIGVSRPVFNNLFNKFKIYNVAEVTSKGAKGTHIKFYNLPLLREEME